MQRILGVLVLYKSSLQESESFRSLSKSLSLLKERLDVLVYDNSPQPMYDEHLFPMENFNVYYVSDTSNPGVGKAYNAGAELASTLKKKWMLLLDQDTVFPENAAELYMKHSDGAEMLGAPILVSDMSVISPCNYKWSRGSALKALPESGISNFHGLSLLNSGLIIPISTYNLAGGYNERIPLDYSDHYFIDKIKKIVSRFYVLDIKCKHGLSASERNVKNALNRFTFYLKGAKEYSKSIDPVATHITVFLRTIKLSLRYKCTHFLRCYCQFFIKA